MQVTRQTPRVRLVRHTLLAGALLAALAVGTTANAARVGHARMVSTSGQPLAVELALREVEAGQADATSARAAPAQAWRDAGLTPPVALESLSFQVLPGSVAGTQVVQVRSNETFHGDIADLLLDIRTAGGQFLHQVSVMAPDARSPKVALAATSAGQGSGSAGRAANMAAGTQKAGLGASGQDSIRVKRGNTLYSIARSNAVPGVSVHQMMMALQAINPEAFIDGNVNRLKAGATLRLPTADELAVLSDAQARRLFQEQGEAFAAYRDRIAGMRGQAASGDATQGQVAAEGAAASAPAASAATDQLVLSGNQAAADARADNRLASDKNIADSRDRIAELEGNVQALSQAVNQGQGGAAAQGNGAGAPGAAGQGDQAAGQQAGQAGENSTTAASAGSGQDGNAGTGANGAPGLPIGQAAGDANAAGAASNNSKVAQTGSPTAQDAEATESWWQRHMLGIVTGLLALLVLLLVWWLRRAGVNRGDADRGAPITEDMVRQKLEQIDLDLNDDTPAADASRRNGGNKSV